MGVNMNDAGLLNSPLTVIQGYCRAVVSFAGKDNLIGG